MQKHRHDCKSTVMLCVCMSVCVCVRACEAYWSGAKPIGVGLGLLGWCWAFWHGAWPSECMEWYVALTVRNSFVLDLCFLRECVSAFLYKAFLLPWFLSCGEWMVAWCHLFILHSFRVKSKWHASTWCPCKQLKLPKHFVYCYYIHWGKKYTIAWGEPSLQC